jgi:hypothetical protein
VREELADTACARLAQVHKRGPGLESGRLGLRRERRRRRAGPALLGTGASPLTGMTAMYVLMSVFHAAPWLKLVSSW